MENKQSPPPNREKLLLHDGKKIPFIEIREELTIGNGFCESKLYYRNRKNGKWQLLVNRKA